MIRTRAKLPGKKNEKRILALDVSQRRRHIDDGIG